MGLGEARAAGSSSVTWIGSGECEGSKSHVSAAQHVALQSSFVQAETAEQGKLRAFNRGRVRAVHGNGAEGDTNISPGVMLERCC